MSLAVGVVLGCAAIATGYQVFQVLAAWRFARLARRAAGVRLPDTALPPVTVLKPLRGRGLQLYENLKSFCRQDYPAYQIVFGLADPTDPALAVAQRVKREFPALDIVISVGDAPGSNRKMANLRHMVTHARHELLVMNDADIRVEPEYLRAMVAPFVTAEGEPPMGLTTCLSRGLPRYGVPSIAEALSMNAVFTPMVLAAQLAQRFRYAFGCSMAFTRTALERIGGFPALADYLADDYLLGDWISGAGYRITLVPSFVRTVPDTPTLRGVWMHQLRWARTYRVCQPAGWFFSVLTHAVSWGVAAVLVTGGAALGWAVLGAAVATRVATLAAVFRLIDDRDSPRHLWLVPLVDLAHSVVWLVSFLGSRVVWGGQPLRVERDGRMVPLGPPPGMPTEEPAAARAAGS